MGRIIGFVGSAVLTYVLIACNGNISNVINNMRESRISGEESGQRRVKSDIELAVDRANADVQQQIQQVCDHVNGQLYGPGTPSRSSSKARQTNQQSVGSITTNPFLE